MLERLHLNTAHEFISGTIQYNAVTKTTQTLVKCRQQKRSFNVCITFYSVFASSFFQTVHHYMKRCIILTHYLVQSTLVISNGKFSVQYGNIRFGLHFILFFFHLLFTIHLLFIFQIIMAPEYSPNGTPVHHREQCAYSFTHRVANRPTVFFFWKLAVKRKTQRKAMQTYARTKTGIKAQTPEALKL